MFWNLLKEKLGDPVSETCPIDPTFWDPVENFLNDCNIKFCLGFNKCQINLYITTFWENSYTHNDTSVYQPYTYLYEIWTGLLLSKQYLHNQSEIIDKEILSSTPV